MLVRRLAGAVAMLLVASGLVVATPSPAGASEALDWSVDVVDTGVASNSITSSSGNVTVAACSSNATYSTKTIDGSGVVLGTTPVSEYGNSTYPVFWPCTWAKAVDATGNVYGIDNTVPSLLQKLASYSPDGSFRWSVQLTVPNCPGSSLIPTFVRVGSDGNIYASGQPQYGSCLGSNHWFVVSYTPNGVLRWQSSLGTRVISELGAYQGGVVVGGNGQIAYFANDGTPGQVFQISENGDIGYTNAALHLDGTFVYRVGRYANWNECQASIYVSTYFVAYTPDGFSYRYNIPACTETWQWVYSSTGYLVYQGREAGGAPTMFVLNSVGNLVRQAALEQDFGGRTYPGGAAMFPDTNGGILMSRYHTRNSGNLWGTDYRLVDPLTGDVRASFSTEDIDSTKSFSISSDSVSLSPGRLYVVARECFSGCSILGSLRVYAVQMPELGMDYPRGALLGVTPQTFDTMAVAGDSFSAGIGSLQTGQSYIDTTCSRSLGAYGPRLAENPTVKLHMPATSFLACSGAVTADVLSSQVGDIPADTKSVFLTIGGNNAKFSRFGALCIFLDCATQGYDQEFDGYLTALPDDLADVYDAVLAQAPNATVYVLGYPHIMPLQDCSNAGSGGWWTALQGAVAANPNGFKQFLQQSFGFSVAEADAAVSSIFTISNDETLAARNLTNALNLAISDAVDGVGSSRLKFVSTNQPGSPLEGHELCSNEPYFNGLSLDFGGTFHPNAAGQNAMHQVALDALATHQPQLVVG